MQTVSVAAVEHPPEAHAKLRTLTNVLNIQLQLKLAWIETGRSALFIQPQCMRDSIDKASTSRLSFWEVPYRQRATTLQTNRGNPEAIPCQSTVRGWGNPTAIVGTASGNDKNICARTH